MKKKSFEGLSGQLSRTQMKSITAGKPLPPYADCTVDCSCGDEPVKQVGQYCYCPSGLNILCTYYY